MSSGDLEVELVSQAIGGDRVALQQLLTLHASQISRLVAHKLPASARGVIDSDDILQQIYVDVFRDISRFEPRSEGSFLAWLRTIADHRVQDAVRALKRVKRGGRLRRVRHVGATPSYSVADLVDLLSAGSHTPSKSVAGHEAVNAVQNAIRDLPDDYRQAVQLRLLAGKSLDETAAAMQRSPRAVQGLVDRAKKKLRAALVRLSRYQ